MIPVGLNAAFRYFKTNDRSAEIENNGSAAASRITRGEGPVFPNLAISAPGLYGVSDLHREAALAQMRVPGEDIRSDFETHGACREVRNADESFPHLGSRVRRSSERPVRAKSSDTSRPWASTAKDIAGCRRRAASYASTAVGRLLISGLACLN